MVVVGLVNLRLPTLLQLIQFFNRLASCEIRREQAFPHLASPPLPFLSRLAIPPIHLGLVVSHVPYELREAWSLELSAEVLSVGAP